MFHLIKYDLKGHKKSLFKLDLRSYGQLLSLFFQKLTDLDFDPYSGQFGQPYVDRE